jgi:hypothetical protein
MRTIDKTENIEKLYNKELKLQFIKEKNQEAVLPNNYLERQFYKASSMERELDKDVSNFTVYEIIEYYKLLNLNVLESLIVMNSEFSMYTQWCLQKSLVSDNQNHFLEVTNDVLLVCLNKAVFNMKIISRETVLKWVEQLPNPKDQFVLLGLFEGLKGKDFCELARLRLEDIDDNIAHLCTGRSIKLSDELIEIIEDCIKEDMYYSITGSEKKVTKLLDNGYIIKDYPNARMDVSDFQIGRKIYNGITRTLNYFDALKYMSANSISESGKLHMIKERARELGMTNKDYIFSNYMSEVENKFDSNIVKSLFWKKYEDFLSEEKGTIETT